MRTTPLSKSLLSPRLGAALVAVVVPLVACSDGGGEGGGGFDADTLPARFDDIDLSSPEAAIETFGDAFAEQDYLTAFRALSEDAQDVVLRIPASLGAPGFASFEPAPEGIDAQYRREAIPELEAAFALPATDPDLWSRPLELHGEQTLADLAQNGALTVDITGGIEFLQRVRPEQEDDEGDEQDVLGRLGGLDGDAAGVRITVVRDIDGRWRVQQLLVENGDSSVYPFAGLVDGPASRIEAVTWVATIDRLRHDAPDAVVDQTIELFERRDWRLFTASMHPTSTGAFFEVLARQEFTGRFLTLDTPSYDERLFDFVNDGSGSVGGYTLLPFEHGIENDSLLVDLDGGVAEPAEPAGPWGDDAAHDARVTTADGEFVITVTELDDGRWALAQVRTVDGNRSTDATPFSAPPRGFDVPDGSKVCPDGIVRYDCGAPDPTARLSENDERRIAELEQEMLDNPALEATNQIVIDSIRYQRQAIPARATCVAMQLGYVEDDALDRTLSRAEAEQLAADYCPGDPSVIPLG